MKKGRYIDHNIAIACLSRKKEKVPFCADVHLQLAATVAERTLLFEQFKRMFSVDYIDIHQQLLSTVRAYHMNSTHLYNDVFIQPEVVVA